MTTETLPVLDPMRYETMPFGKAEEQAQAVGKPLTLTVTCSPKHGVDHTVEFGGRLRRLGHTVVVHIAARMVRSEQHLDELLSAMRESDIHDVFLVGGDQAEPLGPYERSLDLLTALKAHAKAPRSVGVTGYPEGHPLIDAAVLADDLRQKAPMADYVATQMCFQAGAITDWLKATRESGVELPAYIGMPGMVERTKLLEISLRVGVGTSVSYLRKQHGVLRRLLGGGKSAAEDLHGRIEPLIGGELGVAGYHIFTFNRLLETEKFIDSHVAAGSPSRSDGGIRP